MKFSDFYTSVKHCEKASRSSLYFSFSLEFAHLINSLQGDLVGVSLSVLGGRQLIIEFIVADVRNIPHSSSKTVKASVKDMTAASSGRKQENLLVPKLNLSSRANYD